MYKGVHISRWKKTTLFGVHNYSGVCHNQLRYINLNWLWPSDAKWRYKSGPTLVQVVVCCLMGPCHYQKKCWLFVNEVRWYSIPLGALLQEMLKIFISNSRLQLHLLAANELTHWGQMTHICVGRLTSIGSDNGLSPGRRQSIIWTNVGILVIGPLGINCSEISIDIFHWRKYVWKCRLWNVVHFALASIC